MSLVRTNLSTASCLGTALTLISGAFGDQHVTFVQNNGSMDGYYIGDDQQSVGETTSETEAKTTSTVETPTTATIDKTTSTTADVTTPVANTSTTDTTDTTNTAETCQTMWGQCGGKDYTGANCCQDDMACITLDTYWAHCVASTTLSSQKSDTLSVTSSLEGSLHPVTQRSTVYSYNIHSQAIKSISTDVSGHKFTTELNSESTETIIKGFTNVIKMSNETNDAIPTIGGGVSGNWKLNLAIGALIGFGVLAI